MSRAIEAGAKPGRAKRLPKDWFVYVVRCKDRSLYTGIAKDIKARLGKHNSGKGAAYTRSRRPVRLVYQESGFTRSAALVREAQIKRLPRPEKVELIAKIDPHDRAQP